ncbi:DUF975 family protein [Patescibacteria group bacterium]|nr:DUF975 family protein [Patescibacteria group bacterium]RIL00607.1 MAG: hypothetical protein DCC77_03575 [Candidatus Uhrbacteria bacterium]
MEGRSIPAPDADIVRQRERTWRAAVLILAFVGVLLPLEVLQAGPVKDLINYILLGLATILGWLIQFLGTFIVMLVHVVIDVSQYNAFVSSAPVQAGWPLVRDVVNMFFIVVLLVSAFATIVQWKPGQWRYNVVLPKLLLMAVLVNFSLTLIGLLIDFSQVVMLTFVNGFKSAAGGNFITALKLDKIMKLPGDPTLGQSQAAVEAGQLSQQQDSLLIKLLMGEILGIFFLTITLSMLVILLLYLLFRVVGLWIALILSPAAFFASAISKTSVAQYVNVITEGYWSKLGAMLVGGPIMAFFLWLTLATVQQGGFGSFAAQQAAAGETAQLQQSYFATAVGNVQEVATFFVAIIMLMMGVQAAVSIGSSFSPTLGRVAGGIQRGGVAAARFLSYGGLLAGGAMAARGVERGARAAGRAGARGAVAVGRVAESRLNLAGRAGGVLQAAGAATGITALGVAGGQLRGRRVARRREFEERMEGATRDMSAGERIQALERYASRSVDADKKRAAELQLAQLRTSSDGMKATREQKEAEYKASGMSADMAAALAERDARSMAAQDRDLITRIGEETNDQKLLDEARKESQKRPDWIQDDDALRRQVTRMIDDGDANDFMKNVDSRAYQDPRVLDAILTGSGMLDESGEFNKENEYYKKLVEKGGTKGQLLRQRVGELTAAAASRNMPVGAFIQSGEMAGGMYMPGGRDANGRSQYRLYTAKEMEEGAVRAAAAGPARARRRDREIEAGKSEVERYRAAGDARGVQEAQLGMMRAGSRLDEAYKISNGAFENEAEGKSFTANISAIHQAAKQDVNIYNQMDFQTLQQNPRGYNEARRRFAGATDVGALERAAEQAKGSGNKNALESVGRMARIMDQEGARIETVIDKHNKAQEKLGAGAVFVDKKTIKTAKSQADLAAALGASGLNINMLDVDVLKKRDQIRKGSLRDLTGSVSERTARSLAGAAGSATTAAGTSARETLTAEGRLERRLRRGGYRGEGPAGGGGGAPPATPPPGTPPAAPPRGGNAP